MPPLTGTSRRLTLALVACLAGAPASVGGEQKKSSDGVPIHSATFVSQSYHIDRIYKSMQGPVGEQTLSLADMSPPALLWITAYRVEVVGDDGKAPAPQEFMCHNNVDFNVARHRELFGWTRNTTPRLFTLSQGQFALQFPDGFGVPVMSDEVLLLTTQVLNHNQAKIDVNVRHKVTFDYVLDRDVKEPMRPLFPANGYVMVLVEGKDGYFNIDSPTEAQKHASCLPGQVVGNGTKTVMYKDAYGRLFSGHWRVPAGRQEEHALVNQAFRYPVRHHGPLHRCACAPVLRVPRAPRSDHGHDGLQERREVRGEGHRPRSRRLLLERERHPRLQGP